MLVKSFQLNSLMNSPLSIDFDKPRPSAMNKRMNIAEKESEATQNCQEPSTLKPEIIESCIFYSF